MGGRVEGGQAGCERRIEVFVKIKKKWGWWGRGGGRGRVWGIRVDVNGELNEVFGKNFGGGGGWRGVGFVEGVRVGVNEELKFL